MKKLCNLGLAGAMLLLFLPVAAVALDIVYPADGTYTGRGEFLVIKGGANPPLDGLVVSVDGVASDLIDISGADYRAAFGDFLILQPEWNVGKNAVTVDGYVAGKAVVKAQAEIYYLGNDPTAMAPRKYGPFIMHQPQKEALCLPCHVMNPSKAQLSAETAEKNPCASCHRRLLGQAYVHGPAGDYQCVTCHDPNTRPSRYQLTAPITKICVDCHSDKVEEFNKNKFVHGPVGTGLCTLCHDAHASAHPAQLIAPVNTLCLGCHDTVLKSGHVVRGVSGNGHPLTGPSDPFEPRKRFSCVSCHDPHGGASAALFRNGIASRIELCQKCHQK